MRTLPNGLQVVVVPAPRAAGDQHPDAGRGRRRATTRRTSRAWRTSSPRCSTRAPRRDRRGRWPRRWTPSAGSCRSAPAADLTFGFITVLDGQLRRRARPAVGGRAHAGVRRPRNSSASGSRCSPRWPSAPQDPDYVATAVFRRARLRAHPYASTGTGTPESIDRITRDDLVAFHQRHYVPNNCILAIVGDVEPGRGVRGGRARVRGLAAAATCRSR